MEFQYTRVFDYRPLDGARAAGIAIRKAFGFSLGKPIRTFFGTRPPELVDVKVGAGLTEQVPWGALEVPGLEGVVLHLTSTFKPDYGKVFQVVVTGPRKHRFRIEGLMELIERELQTNSIYRGQAIDGSDPPEFLDLSSVDPEAVVYTQDVMRQLEANVWSPIKHADSLALLGQPGKRSVLFEGPYGSGKTLGAYLTAQVAVANGWTLVYCRPGKDDIDTVMQTAVIYQPSVVFVEDLDTIAGADVGTIDHHARVLDMFDGLKSKGLRMLLVLTTNHADKLHKAMLRPGRLDALIHVAEMDEPGVERMVRRTVGDALDPETDFSKVFEAVQGFMPAFVKEAIDRAVRYSVSIHDGRLGGIGTTELVLAAEGLRPQLELMAGAG
ncbi:MAG TPA: ATP-binding protein, partial [Propionibacteriaceae bacterium]|nr:ATP-binding protein [Propionibacteriaceae bacterium]